MAQAGRSFRAGFRASMTSAIGARATDVVLRVAIILFGLLWFVVAGALVLDASTKLFGWPKSSPGLASRFGAR